MKTGVITTMMGTGQRASNGDGGPATEASTLMPDAICLDAHDNLYVGEKYGYRIRKVEAATGIVRTLVGNGVPGYGEEGLPGGQTQCNSVMTARRRQRPFYVALPVWRPVLTGKSTLPMCGISAYAPSTQTQG
jgi:hypothetical protein